MAIQKHLTCWFIRFLISALFLSPLIHGFARSQNRSTPDNSKKSPERSYSPLVIRVKAQVKDQTGNAVADLTKDDFLVYEDGVKQPIVLWTSDGDSEKEGIQPGYEIGYYPIKNLLDGKFRKIRVAVQSKGRGKVKISVSPKGYYAKKELLK